MERYSAVTEHQALGHEGRASAIFRAPDPASAQAGLRALLKSAYGKADRNPLHRKQPRRTTTPLAGASSHDERLVAKMEIPLMGAPCGARPTLPRAARHRALRDIAMAGGALLSGADVRYTVETSISRIFGTLRAKIDSWPQAPHFSLDLPLQMALAEIAEAHCRADGPEGQTLWVRFNIRGSASKTLRAAARKPQGEARERVAATMARLGRGDLAALLRRTACTSR